VLQLGLGSDELTFALADRLKGGKLEVFDDDQAAVDALAERARERGLKNVSGWHGDPHEMLFEENRFDRAILLRARDEVVERELDRVLKPGGSYVATLAAPDAA
jgi:ubiquinone/menaquinone biosynthesis C-methylase UbiE